MGQTYNSSVNYILKENNNVIHLQFYSTQAFNFMKRLKCLVLCMYHDNHHILSYHDNGTLRCDYHTIDIIAHHYINFFLYIQSLYTKVFIAS